MSIVITSQSKSGVTKEVRQNTAAEVEELMVFCPKCKTFETLWFTRNELVKTQKFSQENRHIYHNCDSREPCRMYRALWRDR